ncbi:MAG: hypothetical protein AUG51_10355 [Acidobacteria bacterium 13_1_20CM_3_53_8]|nr:MAG: hypothetical protein AUG51_10355 [Acidobacteria bacterium 13_1_20CM_3_53_8]
MRSLLAIQDAIRLKPTRVLEVAAGGGGLAASLTKVGCSVVVNDLLEEQITGAIKEYCTGDTIKVVGGNMFDLSPIQLCKFDLVIACEVIEHVAHPEDLLNHLKKFLKPEGRILLTTPNGAHFRNNLPTYSEISDFDELESYQFKPDADGHLFLFTPQELSKLAETVGLQIEQISVWGTPMLSGHFGFRFMAGRFLTRAAYKTELLVQHMRSSKRERLCVALSAILRLP